MCVHVCVCVFGCVCLCVQTCCSTFSYIINQSVPVTVTSKLITGSGEWLRVMWDTVPRLFFFFSSPLPFLPTPQFLLFLHFSLLSSSSCPLIASSIFFFHKFPQQEQACSGGESHPNSVYSPSDVWNWSFASFNPSSLHRKLYLLSQWCRSYHKLEFYSKKISINDFLKPHFCHIANQ